ncbi:hypothetical protein JZ751_025236 [Albula glossodonta]|uniref:Uncharacterized protein n=1 Tax=Albula glossodonta TaxID=121402 RepID=A0A8T2NEV0_9TELE|nr:hypothetical protein JZ751_025236 [Albula glossodonta]
MDLTGCGTLRNLGFAPIIFLEVRAKQKKKFKEKALRTVCDGAPDSGAAGRGGLDILEISVILTNKMVN